MWSDPGEVCPNPGRARPTSDRSRPNSVTPMASLANTQRGSSSADVAQTCSKPGQTCPGQSWPTSGQIRPQWRRFGGVRDKCGHSDPNPTNFVRGRPKLVQRGRSRLISPPSRLRRGGVSECGCVAARCEVAPKLPKSCPKDDHKLSQELKLGPDQCSPMFANADQTLTKFGQIRPTLAQVWRISAEFGRHRKMLFELCRADFGRNGPNVG